MLRAHLFWTLVLILFTITLSKPINFDVIRQTVPENEMKNFLRYHISKGFELKAAYHPDFPEFNDDFSQDLYEFFVTNFAITDSDLLRKLQDKICFPDGTCIDLDDPGVRPLVF